MENSIQGIHHITAIAGNAAKNYDFYTRVLGLRLVKKTVNFDDPKTYHLYYGDQVGSPGTILTFFPWGEIGPGRKGTRQVTEIGYLVPENSLDFWRERFQANKILFTEVAEKFGEPYLTVIDPDGLKLELTASASPHTGSPWLTDEVIDLNATRGFHSITITANKIQPTADLLIALGYRLAENYQNRYRYITDASTSANIIDLLEVPAEKPGHVSGGSVHHVAFRVKNEMVLMNYRDKIAAMGYHITEKIDRNYFYSLYFREPGGVLFELATDNPGFSIDEPTEALGTQLMLPVQYEKFRADLEKSLPPLI